MRNTKLGKFRVSRFCYALLRIYGFDPTLMDFDPLWFVHENMMHCVVHMHLSEHPSLPCVLCAMCMCTSGCADLCESARGFVPCGAAVVPVPMPMRGSFVCSLAGFQLYVRHAHVCCVGVRTFCELG